MDELTEADVGAALQQLDPLWEELFPAEQARIVQLLVARVDVAPDGIDIGLRMAGLEHLVHDLSARETRQAACRPPSPPTASHSPPRCPSSSPGPRGPPWSSHPPPPTGRTTSGEPPVGQKGDSG